VEIDKENIQSNLQLLNIRFSSLNEILRTQETEISRVCILIDKLLIFSDFYGWTFELFVI